MNPNDTQEIEELSFDKLLSTRLLNLTSEREISLDALYAVIKDVCDNSGGEPLAEPYLILADSKSCKVLPLKPVLSWLNVRVSSRNDEILVGLEPNVSD